VRFRYVDAGPMDMARSSGLMGVFAASIVNGGPEILMTTLFDTGHFQIGWFDDVDAVIDLDEARRRGVQVFRRPIWGGGCAFYDTRAVATFSWFLRHAEYASVDAALERVRPVMRRALDAVGLRDASFEGSSDIRWRGRKLGTVIAQDVMGTRIVGGFLNLRAPDLETYAAIARVPEEKFKDKVVKDAVAYICTPADVRGSDLAYEELRDAIVRESRAEGMDLEPRPVSEEERAQLAGFEQAINADDWVHRSSSSRFAAAHPGARFANYKAKKLVRAGLALGGDGAIAAAMIAGDMHVSPPEAMDDVAKALVGARASDPADVAARVEAVFENITQPDAAAGITPADVVACVLRAANGAPS
jgi:lipoate-protein ligase A